MYYGFLFFIMCYCWLSIECNEIINNFNTNDNYLISDDDYYSTIDNDDYLISDDEYSNIENDSWNDDFWYKDPN